MFGIEGLIGNARRHRALAHYGIGPQRCAGSFRQFPAILYIFLYGKSGLSVRPP
jgi:hypothetical protein